MFHRIAHDDSTVKWSVQVVATMMEVAYGSAVEGDCWKASKGEIVYDDLPSVWITK